MGRNPCCSKEGLNRGGWTAQEDKILTDYIKAHGEGRWRNLPKKAGLRRCGKSCRLRWLNYLRPDIKRGNISPDEEELIIRLHKLLGNRWSLIAGRLPGRTDNEIKNYWNTRLGKKHQANHEIAHKKTKMPPGTGSALPGQPKHNPQTPVLRTRAFKCSKQVFISPQPPERPELPNSHQSSYQTRDHRRDMPAEPNPMDEKGLSSFDCSNENGLVIDSLLNFDVGDLCLSDLLNFTDFSTSSTCSLEYQPETMLYDELEPNIDSTRVR